MKQRRLLTMAAACAAGLFIGSCARSSGQSDAPKQDIQLPADMQSIDGKVPPNATLEILLKRQNFSTETTGALMKAVTDVFNPRELRANQAYRVTRSLDGFFREFRYQIDQDRLLRVFAAPDADTKPGTAPALTAEVITLPKEYRVEAMVVEIGKGQSLVGVLESRDENVQLALELAMIYGGSVDFNSDLQPGDRFEVLFERAIRNGEFAGYGRVLAAVMTNDSRRQPAVLFEDADGRPAYYDTDGRSLKRQFLKSPLPFDPRITSRFSNRRFHPVYGVYRPHQGVDYGAPYGTAVNVVASGVVDFVGTEGDAGRMVRVRHSGGYQTAYLHLSAFAPGLHVGQRVGQGDFIGRVGQSGAATGPHLHYNIIKNGIHVDPVAELKRMPKGEAIAASQRVAFDSTRDEILGQMATLLAEAQAAATKNAAPQAAAAATSAAPAANKPKTPRK